MRYWTACRHKTRRYRCKRCKGIRNPQKFSSGERAVMKTLTAMRIQFIHDRTNPEMTQFTKKKLRFDFYLPEYQAVIEFNGRQHYEPVAFGGISLERAAVKFDKQQENDKLKRKFCLNQGFKLLEISYKDYGRVNELVADFMISLAARL